MVPAAPMGACTDPLPFLIHPSRVLSLYTKTLLESLWAAPRESPPPEMASLLKATGHGRPEVFRLIVSIRQYDQSSCVPCP